MADQELQFYVNYGIFREGNSINKNLKLFFFTISLEIRNRATWFQADCCFLIFSYILTLLLEKIEPKSILILLKAEGVSTNLCLAKLVIWDRMPFRFLAKAQKFKKDGLLEDFQLLRLKRNERYGYVVW
ncbi:hypothetical protein T12_6471 [Trichinella patagoniensis]|uniref:Uncharacterized protein n=1 Tax=Trichinella patagoniensis TaxID=990121 RepID=A0A0V0ZZ62_9BILA|nr:hypothetical protein T12_6471 [Trichinella patagoniensis]